MISARARTAWEMLGQQVWCGNRLGDLLAQKPLVGPIEAKGGWKIDGSRLSGR